MKVQYKIAIAMVASAALGGLAVEVLHAQAKPPVYVIAEINVTNPDAYAKEYAPKIREVIKAHGGRLLAIGGTGGMAGKVTAIEGEAPQRAAVQVWDSMEKVEAYRNDPKFKELRAIGEKYAKFRTFVIEGLPQ
jgi:uncharacterized protein (DUF1330 family)